MIRIPLRDRQGAVRAWALVDDDRTDLAALRWNLLPTGYVTRRPWGGKTEYLHRRVLGLAAGDGLIADHINRDKLDNRRANLRVTTPDQSRQNTPSFGQTSPHRGVSWDRVRGLWAAYGQKDRKQYNLGRYPTEIEAAEAAAAWRRQHMPFATE